MWVCVCMWVCSPEIRCFQRPEVSDSLDLELQAVVSLLTWILGINLGSSERAESAL